MSLYLYLIVASGLVAQKYNSCIMDWAVVLLVLDWLSEIEPKAARIVGSTDLV